MDVKEYQNILSGALEKRQAFLDKTQFPKLKEEFRNFHAAFAAIYKMMIQKRLIHEDPYKHEAKVGEIVVPPAISSEGDRVDQLTMNLSSYDNQLDFLVNFSQFSVDFLTMDMIRRILALLKYIDWTRFTQNAAPTGTTAAVFDVVNQIRIGGDPLASNVLNESLSTLKNNTGSIMAYLKEAAFYNRENYKLELRKKLTGNMQAAEANQGQIKKKFPAAMPGRPYYPDLVEEVIKEDFSPGGEKLRENVLKQIDIPEKKPKLVKAPVSFKVTLLDGLLVIGSAAISLSELAPRLDENNLILQSRRQSFFEKLRALLRRIFNKEPDPVIYEVEYLDTAKGTMTKEKVNFQFFRADLDKKIRSFSSLGGRGGSTAKLESMEEKQLLGILERAIRDAQNIHKTLNGLDEFFKAAAPRESREKIKGIKPELGAIKNAIIKANQKRHEYSAQIEEEEQLKRLGINQDA